MPTRSTGAFLAPVLRWLGFFGIWLTFGGRAPADLVVGAISAGIAAYVSLHLLQSSCRVDPIALAHFASRFFWQSGRAGVDVACRVFDPRLPLKPGFVTVPTHCSGASLDAFCAVASLQPGTLPVGWGDGGLLVHCLDTEAPVAAEIARDEALFVEMLGGDRHG